jgi:inner membrane protein
LYAILGAEDYALLLGSLVVFGVLGAIMVLTRKVNWAKFGQPTDADSSALASPR